LPFSTYRPSSPAVVDHDMSVIGADGTGAVNAGTVAAVAAAVAAAAASTNLQAPGALDESGALDELGMVDMIDVSGAVSERSASEIDEADLSTVTTSYQVTGKRVLAFKEGFMDPDISDADLRDKIEQEIKAHPELVDGRDIQELFVSTSRYVIERRAWQTLKEPHSDLQGDDLRNAVEEDLDGDPNLLESYAGQVTKLASVEYEHGEPEDEIDMQLGILQSLQPSPDVEDLFVERTQTRAKDQAAFATLHLAQKVVIPSSEDFTVSSRSE
jgi:hypothetical protein